MVQYKIEPRQIIIVNDVQTMINAVRFHFVTKSFEYFFEFFFGSIRSPGINPMLDNFLAKLALNIRVRRNLFESGGDGSLVKLVLTAASEVEVVGEAELDEPRLLVAVFNHDFGFVLANIIPDLVNDIFANDTTGPVKYHSGLWHKVGAI